MNQQMNLLEARATARERERQQAPSGRAVGMRRRRTPARGVARLVLRARLRAARHGGRPAHAVTVRG